MAQISFSRGFSRRATIIVMLIMTVALGFLAVIVGLQLQQSQAPDDAAAATCNPTQTYAGSGCNAGGCQQGFRHELKCECPTNYIWNGTTCQLGDDLNPTQTADTSFVGSCVPDASCQTGGGQTTTTTSPPPTQTCTVTYPGGNTGCINISSGCGNLQVNRFWRNAANGTTNGQCIGTSSNHDVVSLGPGTHCPGTAFGCGRCVQYDYDGPEGSGGVAQFTGNCPVSSSSSTPPPSSSTSSSSTTITTTTTSSSTTSVEPLPETGLFDEDGRPLLIGLMLIIIGILANRIVGGLNLAWSSTKNIKLPKSNITKEDKQRERFEQEVTKDIRERK